MSNVVNNLSKLLFNGAAFRQKQALQYLDLRNIKQFYVTVKIISVVLQVPLNHKLSAICKVNGRIDITLAINFSDDSIRSHGINIVLLKALNVPSRLKGSSALNRLINVFTNDEYLPPFCWNPDAFVNACADNEFWKNELRLLPELHTLAICSCHLRLFSLLRIIGEKFWLIANSVSDRVNCYYLKVWAQIKLSANNDSGSGGTVISSNEFVTNASAILFNVISNFTVDTRITLQEDNRFYLLVCRTLYVYVIRKYTVHLCDSLKNLLFQSVILRLFYRALSTAMTSDFRCAHKSLKRYLVKETNSDIKVGITLSRKMNNKGYL